MEINVERTSVGGIIAEIEYNCCERCIHYKENCIPKLGINWTENTLLCTNFEEIKD